MHSDKPQPSLIHAQASSTRWQCFLGEESNPFSPLMLLRHTAVNWYHWDSGRHAPVSLTLTFDEPATVLGLCPDMKPENGHVALIVVTLENNMRIGHSQEWKNGEWVSIVLPAASQRIRVEFVDSPSWIALRAVRLGASHATDAGI